MVTQDKKTPPVNLKSKNASSTFRIAIRDREHFYAIIKWLNDNVGKGADKWTMEGRVLRALKHGNPANPNIYIFTPDFDHSAALFLSLI